MTSDLDPTDRAILALLQQNARISNAEIGRRIDLATSAVHQRIRKLEEQKVVLGYECRVDPRAAGFGLAAFVMIQTGEGARSGSITERLGAIPEVLEVHRVVGEDCFFVKVRVSNPDELAALLDHTIGPIPGVSGTRTTIVLQTTKESSALPLAEEMAKPSRAELPATWGCHTVAPSPSLPSPRFQRRIPPEPRHRTVLLSASASDSPQWRPNRR